MSNNTILKCPICAQVFAPQEGGGLSNKTSTTTSHNGRMIYISTQCPICQQDECDPPMIALLCGHVLCRDDFHRLGGRWSSKKNLIDTSKTMTSSSSLLPPPSSSSSTTTITAQVAAQVTAESSSQVTQEEQSHHNNYNYNYNQQLNNEDVAEEEEGDDDDDGGDYVLPMAERRELTNTMTSHWRRGIPALTSSTTTISTLSNHYDSNENVLLDEEEEYHSSDLTELAPSSAGSHRSPSFPPNRTTFHQQYDHPQRSRPSPLEDNDDDSYHNNIHMYNRLLRLQEEELALYDLYELLQDANDALDQEYYNHNNNNNNNNNHTDHYNCSYGSSRNNNNNNNVHVDHWIQQALAQSPLDLEDNEETVSMEAMYAPYQAPVEPSLSPFPSRRMTTNDDLPIFRSRATPTNITVGGIWLLVPSSSSPIPLLSASSSDTSSTRPRPWNTTAAYHMSLQLMYIDLSPIDTNLSMIHHQSGLGGEYPRIGTQLVCTSLGTSRYPDVTNRIANSNENSSSRNSHRSNVANRPHRSSVWLSMFHGSRNCVIQGLSYNINNNNNNTLFSVDDDQDNDTNDGYKIVAEYKLPHAVQIVGDSTQVGIWAICQDDDVEDSSRYHILHQKNPTARPTCIITSIIVQSTIENGAGDGDGGIGSCKLISDQSLRHVRPYNQWGEDISNTIGGDQSGGGGGGVWIHFGPHHQLSHEHNLGVTARDDHSLNPPGLWYIPLPQTSHHPKQCVIPYLSFYSKIVATNKGVMVVKPHDGMPSRTVLVHCLHSPRVAFQDLSRSHVEQHTTIIREEVILPIAFIHIGAVIFGNKRLITIDEDYEDDDDDDDLGIILHCQMGGQWTLCRVQKSHLGNTSSSGYHLIPFHNNCPEDSTITEDGHGGVWVFKPQQPQPRGRSCSQPPMQLYHVDGRGRVQHPFQSSFPMGTVTTNSTC